MSNNAKFDPTFTPTVINTTGDKASPRVKEIFTSLFTHLHDFVREVELTPDEWMAGVHFMNSVGQISNSVRNEGQRISDIVGLES